jgi:hypothetical protein
VCAGNREPSINSVVRSIKYGTSSMTWIPLHSSVFQSVQCTGLSVGWLARGSFLLADRFVYTRVTRKGEWGWKLRRRLTDCVCGVATLPQECRTVESLPLTQMCPACHNNLLKSVTRLPFFFRRFRCHYGCLLFQSRHLSYYYGRCRSPLSQYK